MSKQTKSFDECHWFEITCPYKECLSKRLKFSTPESFKHHHESIHCIRDSNGDIIKEAKYRWKCHAEMYIDSSNKSLGKTLCGKVSNSWYNYAGHITSHDDIVGHSWGCLLPPNGRSKKSNIIKNGTLICGKRTSTKHHLIAHIKNVHKSYNISDAKQRNYNNKNRSNKSQIKRKRRRPRFNNNNEPQSKKARYHYNYNHTRNLSQLPPKLASFLPLNYPLNSNSNSLTTDKQNSTLQQQRNFIDLLLMADNIHNCDKCQFNDEFIINLPQIPFIPLIPSLSLSSNNSSNSIEDDNFLSNNLCLLTNTIPSLPFLY